MEQACGQGAECCPGNVGRQDAAEMRSTEDCAWDPTMASCCIRDLQNQQKGEAVRQRLLAADPTQPRKPVVCSGVPAEAAAAAAAVEETAGDELDSDEDAELSAIRERRKGELLQHARRAAQGQAAGYGRLNDVSHAQLLERLESSSGFSVCHCAVEGHEPSTQLDQHLEALAHAYRGTLFMRTLVGRKSPLRSQLSLQCLPALVCFRNGAVIGRTGLLTFGPPDEVLEELVVKYLKRLGVLRQSPGAGGSHPSKQGQTQGSSDSEDEDEDGKGPGDWKNPPCEVCGRCYPHEHVKAVYREHNSSDEEGSDFD